MRKNKHLTFSQKNFDLAIWDIVSNIKPGRVMSYAEVARAAGFPRHARMVSKAMARSYTQLPWYRVVRSDRTLAFEVGSKAYLKQKALLEKEGVQVIKRRVFPCKSEEALDLDKLLWGPCDN